MGFWDRFELSVADCVIIQASVDLVWTMIKDLDHHHEILSAVQSMVRIDGTRRDEPVHVGTKFRRTIRFRGGNGALASQVTVTAIDERTKTLALFADNEDQGMMGRVSWTVVRSDDDNDSGDNDRDDDNNTCRLMVSTTILPRRLWLWFGGLRCMCVCCFRSIAEHGLKHDLQEFAEAAVARRLKQEEEGG